MYSAFQQDYFLLKRQVFSLTGKFRFYDAQGNLILFSEQKMFRLREDIRVYDDENKSQEVLSIRARQIVDFSAAYDVFDGLSGEKVGVLRRKGLKSMVRDEWEALDADERPMGLLVEDNLGLALLRRLLLGSLLPQNYDWVVGETRLADFRQRFNPFRYELEVDLSTDPARQLDRRLAVAAAILLAAIEGRQSD